jgi:hypothetical protein
VNRSSKLLDGSLRMRSISAAFSQAEISDRRAPVRVDWAR